MSCPLSLPEDVLMLLLLALLQAPVRQVTLTTPDKVLAESFSQVRGVRELGNGKVIIVDRLDRGLVGADFASGQVAKIGSDGVGPLEYRLISGLVPLGGDSTLAYDEGNGRFVLVTPDLRVARTFTLVLPGLGLPVGARGVDREGRYYLRISAWMFADRRPHDTLPIVRYDVARGTVDTIAHAKGSTARPSRERRVMGVPYVIFAAEDGWAVTPDGRVAVVRSGDYHVEWHAPGRPVVRGPAVPFTRRRVSAADRFAYIKRFVANSPTSGRDASGRGGLSAGPVLSDAELQVITDAGDFAEVHPPFTDRAPLIGADSTLWVQRSVSLDAPESWDLFDAAARLTTRVTIPAGRRLVALGAGTVYAVVTDEDGLERVERYRMN
jgi:hypothetical protein